MSIYTTPLQFGYFFSLILWLVLLLRGFKEQRLSDKMLGWVMFLLAMEMQDYTFGFSGINFLWNELNGFPRGVNLIFGPVVYFYFRSQVNRNFAFKKAHIWHFTPFLAVFIFKLIIFLQGPGVVEKVQESTFDLILGYTNTLASIVSYSYYFRKCLKIYKDYRKWCENEFSDTERIDFAWFRNFVYAMAFWIICREFMNILDIYLSLDFYQDWWWNLALIAVSIYIGLTGFAQKQPAIINFNKTDKNSVNTEENKIIQVDELYIEKEKLAERITAIMQNDRLYLQPELNLTELAKHLKTNTSLLSSTINQVFQQNFNDYINTLRVQEFIENYKADKQRNFTMIALAIDAGFNSKATFNRAFKKIKGTSPKEYFEKN